MLSGYKGQNKIIAVNLNQVTNIEIVMEEGSDISDNMVFVEGGTFTMGSNDGESDEKPTHKVTLSDFYLGKYEVTQREWREVMGKNPLFFKGDNLPVEMISWYDAVEFCNKISMKDGLKPCYKIDGKNTICNFDANGYRLPTEAEWEYVARGGHKLSGYKYSGSNTINDVAWYENNSNSRTHSVGGKKPNELGIYDMTGNVWEWCWDWYGDYSSSSVTDPKGSSSGKSRILRGGSWRSKDRNNRLANRDRGNPDSRYSDSGFRVVVSSSSVK